jgi:hypothetical protein
MKKHKSPKATRRHARSQKCQSHTKRSYVVYEHFLMPGMTNPASKLVDSKHRHEIAALRRKKYMESIAPAGYTYTVEVE